MSAQQNSVASYTEDDYDALYKGLQDSVSITIHLCTQLIYLFIGVHDTTQTTGL